MLDLPPPQEMADKPPTQLEYQVPQARFFFDDEETDPEWTPTENGSDSVAETAELTKPTSDDLEAVADDILSLFNDGFQWSDLTAMIKQSYDFLVKYKDVSGEERRSYIVTIVSHVIDKTDTPYLPDRFSDPVFKALLPPFVDLFGSAVEGFLDKHNLLEGREGFTDGGKPTAAATLEVAKEIKRMLGDGLQWRDLSTGVKIAIQFARSFDGLTTEERKQVIIDVTDHLIDITDTPRLPDRFSDPIFKSFIGSFVDIVFDGIGN